MITIPRTLSILALALSAPALGGPAAETRPIPGLRVDLRAKPLAVSPMEAIEIEVIITNDGAAVVNDAPIPTFTNDNLTLRLERGGKEIPFTKPVMNLVNAENEILFQDMRPRDRRSAAFKIIYDWDSGRFPFLKAGTYTLSATAHSKNRTQTVISNTVTFTVNEPSESLRLELMELHATEAYPFAFAPAAVTLDREADEKVGRFVKFRSAHPSSPFAAEAPYVAAILYNYRELVTYKDDPAKAAEANGMLKSALNDYIAGGRGAYLAEARELQAKRFAR